MSPGTPITPPVRLDAGACRRLLVADTAAAVRIRTELRTDGIAATAAAVQAAAADPTADLTSLGIPLTAAEVAALKASGTAIDPDTALAFWVQAGEPGRFGGLWIDPPGTGRHVVGILDRDPGAIDLAQCLSAGVDVRYVTAPTSLAELTELKDRIFADLTSGRVGGITLQSVGLTVRSSRMVAIVGVTGLTDAMRADLIARYGDSVVVEEQGPITPAGSPAAS